MNCIVCAIAKMENAYIYEWASYHVQLGFRYIHIYDNNDVNGERVEDVFRGTPIEKQIIIHDVRGKKYIQKRVYQECYDTEDFEWCAFIDVDEFITLPDSQDINAYLETMKGWDAVHLNWMCYGDNGMINKDARSVTERFSKPWGKDVRYTYYNHRENEHIKSIIRKGLTIDWVSGEDSNPHTPKGLQEICNAIGLQVKNEPFAPVFHEGAYIRHYITKTIEEYAVKVERQCADCDAQYYSYFKFFRVNTPSMRKLRWLKLHHPAVSIWECIKEHIRYVIVNNNLPLKQFVKAYKRQMSEKEGYENKLQAFSRRQKDVLGNASSGGVNHCMVLVWQ